jgi:DNA-binding NtrC family response regulator
VSGVPFAWEIQGRVEIMSPVRLLLVDDEERFLATSRILLEKRGLENVHTAATGEEALAIMRRERIDVVVLDVKMPGMDGVDVLKRIKQEKPLVEVIMLTGHASVESAVDGLKLGAFDYVMKPIDIPDLLAKIKEAYAKKKVHDEKIRTAKVKEIISHPMAVFSEKTGD